LKEADVYLREQKIDIFLPMAYEFQLPSLYSLNQAPNQNEVQQLVIPESSMSGEKEAYNLSGTRAIVLTPKSAAALSDKILIVDKLPESPHSFSRVIFIPKQVDTAGFTDFSKCRWITHPSTRKVSDYSA
jgi:hypothetical protein